MADFQQPPSGQGYSGYPGAKHGAVYDKGYGEDAQAQQQHHHERDSGYGSYANDAGAHYDPNYFPPPPKPDAHHGYPQEQAYYQHENSSYASQQQQQPSWQGSQQGGNWQGSQQGSFRGRVPSDAYAYEGAALEPYDEEKAYAQYTDAYGPPDYSQYGQQQYPAQPRPPPSATSIDGYGRGYDERRRRSYQDDRGPPRYDDRDMYRDRYRNDRGNSRAPTTTTADYDRRRREHRERARDDDFYDYRPRERKHISPPTKANGAKGGKDILRGGDGERGLGATLLGGAAGAFLGDQADRGALGTIGGAVLGAVAAGGIDRMKSKKDHEKLLKDRRRYEKEYVGNGVGQDPYYSARGPTVSPAPPRDEFRPRRQLRGQPGGGRSRGRMEHSSSDSYTSDD